jgi:uncharacterized membrane protein
MPDQTSILLVIAMMAAVVYLTRVSGYFIGLQLRHISGIKPILETLPGCAFMAILVPAVRQGSLSEIIAMVCLIALMWRTNNVAISTIVSMAVLFIGNVYLSRP